MGVFYYKKPGGDLLSHGQSTLSSAQSRFTALFGMGRGGTSALCSSGILLFGRALGVLSAAWPMHSGEVKIGCEVVFWARCTMPWYCLRL